MNVDEARRERHAGTVDDVLRFAAGAITDQGDATLESSDIGHKRLGSFTVVDLGFLKDRVQQRLA
jgi:hypothetical protein